MSNALLFWAMLIAGLAGVVESLFVWKGRRRYWLKWYDDPTLPFWVRNSGLLGGFPAALGALLLGTVMLLVNRGVPSWVLLGAGGVAFASFFLMVLVSYHAPNWAKPRWLRERDIQHPPPPDENKDRFLMLLVAIPSALIASVCFIALFATVLGN